MNVVNTYYNMYKIMLSQTVLEESHLMVESRLKDVNALKKNGMATQNDVLKVELQKSNIELNQMELMVNGKEIANAYTELNDPIDQLARFEDQVKLMERGDDEAMFIDHDFIRAMEYGMPPMSGSGVGIDRLAMLMTNHSTIPEVLFFPQMNLEK